MTAQHLRDLTGPRRHAVLCASIIKFESMLTDTTLSMFDKLMVLPSRLRRSQGPRRGHRLLRVSAQASATA